MKIRRKENCDGSQDSRTWPLLEESARYYIVQGLGLDVSALAKGTFEAVPDEPELVDVTGEGQVVTADQGRFHNRILKIRGEDLTLGMGDEWRFMKAYVIPDESIMHPYDRCGLEQFWKPVLTVWGPKS